MADGWFLETASVFGRRYGTPIHQVHEPLLAGNDVMVRLDGQGARETEAALSRRDCDLHRAALA